MGVEGDLVIRESEKQLRDEVSRAHAFIGSLSYMGKYRLHLYAIGYASACVLYADALLALLRNAQYLSTWPLLRAAIEAMSQVDRIESDPEKALVDMEFAAADSRASWFTASEMTNLDMVNVDLTNVDSLKNEAAKLKNIGAEKHKYYNQINAVDSRLQSEVNPPAGTHLPRFLPLWKMCSQLSHLNAHGVLNLLCDDDNDGSFSLNPSKIVPSEMLVIQIDGMCRTLVVAMCRLQVFMKNSTVSKDTGGSTLTREFVETYNDLLTRLK